MAAINIRKGDLVQVITGKDRGRTGKVIRVLVEDSKVVVEGVNQVKRHTKPGQGQGAASGGIITQEAPVHVSNVQLVDPKDNRPTRVRFRRETVTKSRPDGTTYESSRSVRVSVRSGEDI